MRLMFWWKDNRLDESPVSSNSAIAESGAKGLECSWCQVDGNGTGGASTTGIDNADSDLSAGDIVGDNCALTA